MPPSQPAEMEIFVQRIDFFQGDTIARQIIRRYNTTINVFQSPSGNAKQPLALNFSPSSLNVMFSDSVRSVSNSFSQLSKTSPKSFPICCLAVSGATFSVRSHFGSSDYFW